MTERRCKEGAKEPRKSVEPGHDKHIAAPHSGQGLGQLRPRRLGAGNVLAKYFEAAGGFQHIDLGVSRLVLG